MAEDNLKQLVAQGLAAMHAGAQVAAKATDEITGDARHPALKEALQQGNDQSKQWAERIDRARQQAGGDGPNDNPVLEAHYEVSRRIRGQAPDDTTRDLGIIAAGQLALHYWIAAFGTMANYANKLGMDDVGRDMKQSADEAKQADEKHTQIAEQLLG
jgi:ferritin-like metal-binding protein YciE